MSTGTAISAIVRPERILLASEGAGDGLPARVSDVIYLGQSVRYHLQTRQGNEIVAASADRGIRFAPGEAVRLSWPRDDVWVIPETADQAAVSAGPLAARNSSKASTKAS
jgi:putative spermidine/putrescine transport system ATP-binding protein